MASASPPQSPFRKPKVPRNDACLPDIKALVTAIGNHFSPAPGTCITPLNLKYRVLAVDSSHPILVVEPNDSTKQRLLLKCRRKHGLVHQSLNTEYRFLSQIGPQLSAENPYIRCPEAKAFFAEQQVLIMEMIEGERLSSIQFSLGMSRLSAHLPALLHLCAAWLARLHLLTQTNARENPFRLLAASLEQHNRRASFIRHAGHRAYDSCLSFLLKYQGRYSDYTEPLCTLHGEFAPYHVLVRGTSIYVIDLASSRTGYALEDVAFFETFFDALLPWRHIAGLMPLGPTQQKRIFLDAYLNATSSLSEPARAVLRFTRINSMLTFMGTLEAKDTWKRCVYSYVALPWFRHKLRVVVQRELLALARAERELDAP